MEKLTLPTCHPSLSRGPRSDRRDRVWYSGPRQEPGCQSKGLCQLQHPHTTQWVVHYCICISIHAPCIYTAFSISSVHSLYIKYLLACRQCCVCPFVAVLEHMDRVATAAAAQGLNFKLREGFSAETSGTLAQAVVMNYRFNKMCTPNEVWIVACQ